MTQHTAGPETDRRSRLGRIGAWAVATVLGGAALVLLTSAPASAAPAAPTGCSTGSLLGDTIGVDAIEAGAQQDFFVRLNDLRRSKGLGTLAWNGAIATPGIGWSQTMSAQDWLHHARDVDGWGGADGVEPNQDYVTINSKLVPNWERLAENVGVASMYSSCTMGDLEANTAKAVEALHNAFVNSSGHYKNMVGDHNQVGIGVHIDHAKLWVTVRFAKGSLPTGSSSASTVVTSQTARYIDAVYDLFVGRTATSGEKAGWAPHVQSGNRKALTSALSVSDQWAGTRINDLYRKILGRDADAAGRSYWLQQVRAGYPIHKAAVEFYGSAEYYRANGGTSHSFISALYLDLLERKADSTGVAYWKEHLRTGRLTRSGVAENFYASIESRRDRVVSLHQEIFGTTIGGTARDSWAARLAWIGDVALAAEFAATNTYWSMATS